MKRFKHSGIHKALLAALACLNISPAQGVLRGEGDRGTSQLPIQSIVLKPYRIIAALSVTEADHSGRTGVFDIAAGVTVTLPRSTGSGARFRFVVKTAVTSVNDVVKVANADDVFVGNVLAETDDAANVPQSFPTAATSDTLTLNGTTTGGAGGDWIEIEDVAEGFWAITGVIRASGVEATPFSATV